MNRPKHAMFTFIKSPSRPRNPVLVAALIACSCSLSNSGSLAAAPSSAVFGWGRNGFGQSDAPEWLVDAVAIAAGTSHSVALRANGQVAAWGASFFGQTNLPPDLTNAVAIAAGWDHSLALRADGTVVAWGDNRMLQTRVPAGLGAVTKIAAGANQNLALRDDGTVVVWGCCESQTNVPPGLSNVIAIAAGEGHDLALRSDGTVVVWGRNEYGQANMPAGLSNAVAIAAGSRHSLALRVDGTVVAWGANNQGQTDVPPGLDDVVAIAAGEAHSLALRADGTVVAWGANGDGQAAVPPGLEHVDAVAAGRFHSLALVGGFPAILASPADQSVLVGDTAVFSVTAAGNPTPVYQWRLNGLEVPQGTNSSLVLNNVTTNQAGAYSVVVSNAVGSVTSRVAVLTVVTSGVPVIITSMFLPTGVVGLAYSTTLVATGGAPPYAWMIVSGSLPTGLSLGRNTGTISGRPSAVTSNWFRVRVTSSDSVWSERNFALVVNLTQGSPSEAAFLWSRQLGGLDGDEGYAIAVDADMNTHVTGGFRLVGTVSDAQFTSHGSADIFVAKYDLAGNPLWAAAGGGEGYDVGRGIALDAEGNCLVAGGFASTNATFGATQLTNRGDTDCFLGKYDPAGQLLWMRQAGGAGADWATGVAVDADGNCFVTGYFSGEAAFDGTNVVSQGATDVFVAKYDRMGRLLWVRAAGGLANDAGRGVAVGPAGTCYVTGSFSDAIRFGAQSLSSAGSSDIFAVKYDSEGRVLWAGRAGGPNADSGNGIATGTAGECYLVGGFAEAGEFGTNTLLSRGAFDGFIAGISSSGSVLWAQGFGSTNSDWCSAVAAHPAGGCFVTGGFSGPGDFGTNALEGSLSSDAFVLRCDGDGHLLWARQAGGTNADWGHGIAADHAGSSYVVGSFTRTSAFGQTALTAQGGADVFLAKLGTNSLAISEQPRNQTVLAGTNATLSVTAIGEGPFRYQWWFEAAPVPGATNRTLVLDPLTLAHAGNYHVVVSNPHGGLNSAVATVSVRIAPPSFILQPQSQTAQAGSYVAFSAHADGSPPLGFQWLRNGLPLEGATNLAVVFNQVQATDQGDYTVVLSNAFGMVTSEVAVLTVTNPAPARLGIGAVSAAHVLLELSSEPGWAYELQTSTNLVNWESIVILTNSSGVARLPMAVEPGCAVRFYRAQRRGGGEGGASL